MTVLDTLRPRGAALWDALGQDLDTPAGAVALEACRTVDRLDRLHSYLDGGADWLDLVEQRPEGSGHFTVVVDKALGEARQQQLALKQLLLTLGIDRAAGAPTEGDESPLARVLALVADPAGSTG